jgi:periplasmic protein TonB
VTIGTRHWLVAIGVAFGLHVVALLTLDLGHSPVVLGTGGGVRIALGDAIGPPAGVPATPTPPPPPAAQPPPKPVPAPEPPPRPARSPEAVKEPPRSREIPAEPKPAPPPSQPTPAAAAANPAERASAAAAPSATESDDRRAALAPGAPGPAPAARASERGLAGLDPAYVRRFLASLERQKQYPRAARTRRMEGTALLWVRLDRDGQVLAYDVEESSGHRVLDRAVLRAIERANPLPPLPDSYPADELEVVIPIAFRLQ